MEFDVVEGEKEAEAANVTASGGAAVQASTLVTGTATSAIPSEEAKASSSHLGCWGQLTTWVGAMYGVGESPLDVKLQGGRGLVCGYHTMSEMVGLSSYVARLLTSCVWKLMCRRIVVLHGLMVFHLFYGAIKCPINAQIGRVTPWFWCIEICPKWYLNDNATKEVICS